ncbi:beta-ketoacyl reductase, partial [Streptomyces sp. ESR1.13]|uniref:beta-ketoacyl reductase n=1 Tax=unclassified Streptomyces TaxID=2593676 RepID=UPI004042B8A0
MIGTLTADRLRRVLAPKVDALRHLDELCPDARLFVTFSSSAGVFGNPGQGNYAAANAAVDAVIQNRRARGGAGIALAWGLWDRDAGMGGSVDRDRAARHGMTALTDEAGLALWDAALAQGRALVMPADLNERALPRTPLLAALRRDTATSRQRTEGAVRTWRLPGRSRERFVLDTVLDHIAQVLGHTDRAQIEPGRPFTHLGFDSLSAVELRNRLARTTGLSLPVTLTFDHPTPEVLARFLLTEATGAEEPEPATTTTTTGTT